MGSVSSVCRPICASNRPLGCLTTDQLIGAWSVERWEWSDHCSAREQSLDQPPPLDHPVISIIEIESAAINNIVMFKSITNSACMPLSLDALIECGNVQKLNLVAYHRLQPITFLCPFFPQGYCWFDCLNGFETCFKKVLKCASCIQVAINEGYGFKHHLSCYRDSS